MRNWLKPVFAAILWGGACLALLSPAANCPAQSNIGPYNTTAEWRRSATLDSASTKTLSVAGATWIDLAGQGDEAYYAIWPSDSPGTLATVSSAQTLAANVVYRLYVDDNSALKQYQQVEVLDVDDGSVKARGIVSAPSWTNTQALGADSTATPPPEWVVLTLGYAPESAFQDGDTIQNVRPSAAASGGTMDGLPVGTPLLPGETQTLLVPGFATRSGQIVIVRGASTAVTVSLMQRVGSQP